MPGIDGRWDEADTAAGSACQESSGADAGQRLLVADEGMRREHALSYRAAVDSAYRDAGADSDGGVVGQPDSLPDDIHGLPDMARRYPADYTPWPGPRESVTEPRELAAWLPDTNPDKAGPGRWNNCGECARAVAATWHGRTVTAAALADDSAGGEPVARMAEWAGQRPVAVSMTQVKDRLDELGPGSVAVVGFDRPSGGGHWFNAVNDDGTVTAVDGQSGLRETWPPTTDGLGFDESEMRYSDAIFFTADGKVVRDDHPG